MPKKKALLLIDGGIVIKKLLLEKKRYILGRSDTADLILSNKEISRQHARLDFREGNYVIKDLNSTNGTFVNGKKITESILKPGDEIIIGGFSIFFDDGSGVFPYYDETQVGKRGEETAIIENQFSHLSEKIRDKKLRTEFRKFHGIVRKSRKRLSKLAHQDKLTGLFNRQYFDNAYKRIFQEAEANKSSLSLLFIDIDHFKLINDEYGHQMGDEILKIVANLISASCRKEDVIGRWGGEEIVVILPGTAACDALKVAEDIRKIVAQETKNLTGLKVMVSIGVANFPEDCHEPKLLIEYADKALYKAKRRGRNRVIRYNGKRS